MGVGVSLILIAAGAVLAWAVDAQVSGVDLQAVGWVLFVVGIVGLIVSMLFWSSWGGPAAFRSRRYVEEDAPPRY